MATVHPERPNLDYEEQRVRILRAIEEVEKFAAESRKLNADMMKAQAEVGYMPRAFAFQAMLASAALLGAGAAVAKLFFP